MYYVFLVVATIVISAIFLVGLAAIVAAMAFSVLCLIERVERKMHEEVRGVRKEEPRYSRWEH